MTAADLIWVWLAVAVVAGILEILTVNLVFVMFTAGGAAAALGAAVGLGPWWQVAVFAAVSAVGLVFLRKPLLARLQRNEPELRTGIAGLRDAQAVSISSLTTHGGTIRLAGQEWTARLDDAYYSASDELAPGTAVTITRIDGVTALVHESA